MRQSDKLNNTELDFSNIIHSHTSHVQCETQGILTWMHWSHRCCMSLATSRWNLVTEFQVARSPWFAHYIVSNKCLGNLAVLTEEPFSPTGAVSHPDLCITDHVLFVASLIASKPSHWPSCWNVGMPSLQLALRQQWFLESEFNHDQKWFRDFPIWNIQYILKCGLVPEVFYSQKMAYISWL